MLKFTVSGRVTETRELRSAQEKGGKIWRRLWKVSYDGGAVDVCFASDDQGEALYKLCKPGDEIAVQGHVTQDKMGSTFVYDHHEVITADAKAIAALVAVGMTQQQAETILANQKKASGAKGAA